MRKVMWCCALLALLLAAGVYVSADYANRHTDSMVGQCVVTTCRAGTKYNPIYQMGQAAVGRTWHGVQESLTDETEEEGIETSPVAEPGAAAVQQSAHGHMLGHIVIQPDADEPAVAPPAPGAVEECDTAPARMQHVGEGCDAPAKMGYAIEDDVYGQESASLEALWALFKETAGHCTDSGSGAECEPGAKDMPDCREDPDYGHNYPGCPRSGCCPFSGKSPRNEDGVPLAKPRKSTSKKAPVRSGSDTSEFRPNDASPTNFETYPYPY